jgi:hypothetical protein
VIWFKYCPKCSGDVYRDKDLYGPFIACIQCGQTTDLQKDGTAMKPLTAKPREYKRQWGRIAVG